MTKCYLHSPVYSMLLVLMLFTPCKGQTKSEKLDGLIDKFIRDLNDQVAINLKFNKS